MNTREKHTVTFFCPGTFVSEQTERDAESWDVQQAFGDSQKITERHDARPYGFQFSTYLTADPVPDGRGGFLEVRPRFLRKSPMYYVNGRVMTLADVERDLPDGSVLLSNMRCNNIARIVTGPLNGKNWRWTMEFGENSVLLDADGNPSEVSP